VTLNRPTPISGLPFEVDLLLVSTTITTKGSSVKEKRSSSTPKKGCRNWQAHSGPGLHVLPRQTEIQRGATVIVTLGLIVALAAPCRIVEVVDEPRRWGFAYGTLPGHREQGEEAFVLKWADDDTVHFEVSAFSRPADRLVRLAGPIGRRICA